VPHDPDRLKSRRADQKSRTTRARLTAVVIALLAIAAIGIAVAAGSGGENKSPQKTAADGSAATKASDQSGNSGATAQSGPKWEQRLSTPAQEAAAIERFAKLGKPIYCGGTGRPYVALTFDDGPGVYTHFALKKLREWHAKATFFVMGEFLRQPEWKPWAIREKAMADTGDHTWSHPYLPGLGAAQVRSQISDTKNIAEQVTGRPVGVFRPPYGAHNPTIDQIASSLGMAQIIWNIDSRDSLGANWDGIRHNVIDGLKPGAIILMHENRGQTIRALPYILPELAKRHLTAVTVPEMLALDPPSDGQLAQGAGGCGLGAGGVKSGA
jgi:peptidoglycan/xylan/chitin deacetylase (PgdA/CDA1 family)